ncbi:MAG: hypothetical protein M3173_08175 [Chloroflexota bacterium]|nr:hypothetical protein [Chloroflexota bacterium]
MAIAGASAILGEDGTLDREDENALCSDINDDGVDEIGLDRDGDYMLDETEVLGEDLNNDLELTVVEFDPAVAQPDDSGESGDEPYVIDIFTDLELVVRIEVGPDADEDSMSGGDDDPEEEMPSVDESGI